MMFGNWGSGWGYGGMGWGMLLFWGLGIVGVIVLVRLLATDRRLPPPEPPSALEILAQRYARGEIEREEFEQKRRDLGGA